LQVSNISGQVKNSEFTHFLPQACLPIYIYWALWHGFDVPQSWGIKGNCK
jgi:hypothetical protein